MESQNLILYDWLSFTTREFTAWQMVDLLGLGSCPFESVKGARGYKDRLYFNAISIHCNGRDDMGIWVEMSGQGCRAFEELTKLPGKWSDLFFIVLSHGFHVTRLDVAYDDHVGVLNIDQLIFDRRAGEYVSKSDYWEIIESSKGQTLQFGSPQSDVLIRIYDKARERNCAAGVHWIRCELQLRNDRALAFIDLRDLTIGQAYCGVVVNYLRYVDPDELDSNKWRWPIKPYWGDFLCNAEAVKIYRAPGLEYNLDRCEKYVIKQAGNAIDAYIRIVGREHFFDELSSRKTARNPKYDQLVQRYQIVSQRRD